MADVGTDLWMLSGPNPLHKHAEHVTQDHVQVAIEDLQGRRLHSLPGYLGPVLSNKLLPVVQTEPLVYQPGVHSFLFWHWASLE